LRLKHRLIGHNCFVCRYALLRLNRFVVCHSVCWPFSDHLRKTNIFNWFT
jgi:hypothetical protein